jgi:hypothetical protein
MTRYCVVVLSLLTAMLAALSGCGGGATDVDDGLGDLREQRLTLILRVQDADDNPIGNAQVFVDGRRDDWRTDSEFSRLGEGFPPAWQDFLCNWVSEGWSMYYEPGDPLGGRLDLAVRKVGWDEGLTIVIIPDTDVNRFFVRDTITLYPEGSGQNPPEPQYAEVLADPDYVAAAAVGDTRQRIRAHQ